MHPLWFNGQNYGGQQQSTIEIGYYPSSTNGMPHWTWRVSLANSIYLNGIAYSYEDAWSLAASAIIAYFNAPDDRLRYMMPWQSIDP